MKFWEIFRFEFGYQARRVSTWLYFALLLLVSFLMARNVFVTEALEGGYYLNAPFAVAQVTLVACIMSLAALAPLAGNAAARDIETRLHPIIYAAPVDKFAYLGGRFLGAFALGALIMATIPIGILTATLLPGERAELLGPIQPAAYVSAYFLLALPNAFVAMSLMFAAAVFIRRGVAGYLGAAFVLFAAIVSWQVVAALLEHWELAKMTDPLGLTVFGELGKIWTPGQKNTLVVGTQTWMLSNRLVWIGISLCMLALTCIRFRFAHIGVSERRWLRRRNNRHFTSADDTGKKDQADAFAFTNSRTARIVVPPVQRAFGTATRARQTLAVALESFRVVVSGWGLPAVGAVAVLVNLIAPLVFQDNGFPQIPTTGEFVNVLEQSGEHGMWLIIPLLIIYYAGELIRRERDARLGEITGASPVPFWVWFAGKFAGLALGIAAAQTVIMLSAMIAQASMGYYEFEPLLYVKILFGIRLADYLLFALLALVIQIIVNQKYVSHLIVIFAYALAAFGPQFGIEPGLHIYGSDPGWSYSDMRGLDPFFKPWLLFKLYWLAWALLLTVAAKMLWSRGAEQGFRARFRTARRRFTRLTAATAAVAAGFVLIFGGLIFYNTNVLYASRSAPVGTEWQAEYERRYGRYADVPQPRPTAAKLHVEIYPERGSADIRGTFDLVNKTGAAIEAIHIATALEVETRISFDRPFQIELEDEKLGHRIYALETPLRPGDSLRLEFEVRFAPRGFPRSNIDASVVANGTFFGNECLPGIGYQRGRELREAAERREYDLAPRPEIPPLDDREALAKSSLSEPIMFEAVVGTDEGQTAIAPGALRRVWTEGGRCYFQYVTDAPIRNNFAFFSAAYAVREARWNDVEIQIFHHPSHKLNVDRMIRGVQASLDHLTGRLGAYPHRQIRFVEHPGRRRTLFANPVNIRYQEGFSFINADGDPRGIDLPFAVVAHEVAHQWWGNQLLPAPVVGAPLLTESLAWDSAMEIVEAHYGQVHRERLLGAMREDLLTPRPLAAAPILRATDRYQWYRKGVIALNTLREYIGAERVNTALRRFFENYGGANAGQLPITLDLYRELQAAAPEEFQYLLADLFERNTYWELAAKQVAAEQIAAGEWQVTLDVQARKFTVDEQGVETEIPMNDFVEIGVFAADDNSKVPPYLKLHRIRSGEQRITITVPNEPSRAGIDPRQLLFDLKPDDNFKEIDRP